MNEAHIYIYGEISGENNKKKYGSVGLKDVVSQMQAGKDADIFKVHIRSEGGDVNEGFLIHDALLNSGKTIETIGEGIVASIATVIFLSGSKRTMNSNSEFTIHNPWAAVKGTASDLQANADGLLQIENILTDFYSMKTGIESGLLKELMRKETTLTSEQAKNYGFATDVIEQLQAVALFNNKNNDKMTKDELSNEMDAKLDGFFAKFLKLFKGAKALVVTTGDGSMLDFGDQVQEESQISVGMSATIDGAPAVGDYVMPDGRTFKFEAGKLVEIAEADNTEDIAALQSKNNELQAEIDALKAQNSTLSNSVTEIKKEFMNLKSLVKTDIEAFAKTVKEDENPQVVVRQLFKN